MGIIWTSFKNRFFMQKKTSALILGLDAAGKTTFLYKLRDNEIKNTIPTIGFNIEKVSVGNLTFTGWDVTGQYQYNNKCRALMRHYLGEKDFVVFMIDSSTPERDQEVVELFNYLLD